jgi:nucleoside 2-deoxyribosyltransferase
MASKKTRPFPRRTVEQALRIPRTLRDKNGGQPWETAEVAKALNLGPKSGNFFYLTSASKQYGLTEGTSQTNEIKLTELGRRAVYPSSAEEERAALREAFLRVPSFRGVLEHYGGTNLPEKQYRENTLFTKFNLDPQVQDEFVELLGKNARLTGTGENLEAAPKPSTPAPAPTPTEAPAAETIAQPAETTDETPVCFVIMPFVVHDEDLYPVGFFEEVLASLFTPAITGADLQVRTAQRHGSDLIHQTIISELLNADLVLADLTEHNPNVLFELGMRIAENKPVVLVRATGTGPIFDVDHVLRIQEYSPNLWPSTVERDRPVLEAHIRAGWENRDAVETYRNILTGMPAAAA